MDNFSRTQVVIPVLEGYRKEFCDFMGYEFVNKIGETYLYKIPANHICRLFINSEAWKNGNFNKEKFLESTGPCY